LFSAGFQLVLQACLALFDLIYFLHLIKKKKELSVSYGCLLHPSLSQVINARSFQIFPSCPFLKWPKTKGNKQP
jgi:hypothetical protein